MKRVKNGDAGGGALKISVDAIVMDYDRTVADETLGFKISDDVKRELRNLRCKLILATGRRLDDIPDKEAVEIFHAIITENGTICNTEKGGVRRILVEDGWFDKKERLNRLFLKGGLNFHSGEVILAGYIEDLEKFRSIIHDARMDQEVLIEFNKEGLMVLPAGWNKGRGTKIALEALGGGRLLAIGDDFNDFSLFEVADIKVAVKNAVPELKVKADIVCDKEEGEGVIEIITSLMRR
jgi:hydroxymethylpyrimidine pyrophosphatase-like HAD family hydrolase